MSLAIKFGDTADASVLSGFIYFDAVTDYSRRLSGKTTAHPIDAGALITDHFVSENKKFNIKGVITGADIGGQGYLLDIEGDSPFNTNPVPSAVNISDQGSDLFNFLPDSVKQFLSVTSPQVTVDQTTRVDYKNQVWNILDKLMTALVYDDKNRKMKNKMTVITLYELEGVKLEKQHKDLIITDFVVDEDADSGEGMFFTMTLESVRFVTLEKVDLPKDVAASLKKSAASKSSKAKVNSTPSDVKPSDEFSPKIKKKPTAAESIAQNKARIDELLRK